MPQPTLKQVKLPQLEKFKADELLDVEAFKDFVAPNTTTDRPLFLRKHLLNVHKKAVEALRTEKIRLVSLVSCPGTGKTWCGWLVAYTLQKEGTETLRLTIRNSTVTAIDSFKEKRQYEEVHWNWHLLKQVLWKSKCDVCIVDVSMNIADEATRVFTGIQQLIEDGKFAGVKFMGLLSGHGQRTTTGKQSNILVLTQSLVLWSWMEEEVQTLQAGMQKVGFELPPGAYAVCGGSVRHLFDPNADEKQILGAVRGLTQADMVNLLALDVSLDDVQQKNRTGLLSFFPRTGANADDGSFAQGVSAARPMPRSDFVIKCIKENKYAKFEAVLGMYKELSNINAGAAGTAFELLVHLFWREAAANEQEVELSLTAEGKTESEEVKVDCTEFQDKQSIEEHDKKDVVVRDDLVGYFTPVDPRYPVLDSILRYKSADKTEALAIQISIALTHLHGELKPLPKLLLPPGSGRPRLALWDFRKGNKSCDWTPNKSEHWELLHVSCKAFDERMLGRL